MAEMRRVSPLLEREHENALLERAWRDAVAGRGSTWLVCAEAGGGKTRLISEFADGVGRSRTRWGAAEPVGPPEPYLAVTRAVPGFTPGSSRAETVAAVLAHLDEGGGPLLLVQDDLHFADEGTIAVLGRLAREAGARPWLVVAAFRPDEGSATLRALATELVGQGSARRLDLRALSRDAVARLVLAVRRASATDTDLEAIYRDSGGNPWFAEALARGNGAVNTARDRIALRLERLEAATPGAVLLLTAIAPATRPLPHAVVAELRGGDSSALRRTLTHLRDSGLLYETEEGWQFRHELLRRSILEMLLTVERRDAHRALAEVLAGEADGPTRGSAAELAMLFAAAGDARAVEWSVQAAREARAVDAHAEALGQLERALEFERSPEGRRVILRDAAIEAHDLGRFADERRLAEEGLTIPDGEPEARATLHQLAARGAWTTGDLRADEAHLTAAERLLDGRPLSGAAVNNAVARVARAALAVRPQLLAPAAERALRLARGLPNASMALAVEGQVNVYVCASRLDSGDPSGLALLEEVLQLCAEHALPSGLAASALLNAHQAAVFALLHHAASGLYERALAAVTPYELKWASFIQPHHVLELVQRGRYAEARALVEAIDAPAAGTIEDADLRSAQILCAARGGSLERARALLPDTPPTHSFQPAAFYVLAQLELAVLTEDPGLGELAQRVYGTMNRHHYARVAAVAAVALARSGRGAAPPPGWLVAASPLRVFWDWAAGIDRSDAALLRDVAGRLAAMDCPYEAAIALADAGELREAYRGLRALGATHARDRLAERLRASNERIPRRTRAAGARAGLTDTEQRVCRLVAAGDSNKEIAGALGISVATVSTHLTRIYTKTGQRGRTGLALWWSHQSDL